MAIFWAWAAGEVPHTISMGEFLQSVSATVQSSAEALVVTETTGGSRRDAMTQTQSLAGIATDPDQTDSPFLYVFRSVPVQSIGGITDPPSLQDRYAAAAREGDLPQRVTALYRADGDLCLALAAAGGAIAFVASKVLT